MGALLAWRGWAIGNRLSTYSEVLPLPPLSSLETSFPLQRKDGTKPFGTDLDGRTGYSARVRYSDPQPANVIYTYLDNRGDRELHRGEYAWATKFHLSPWKSCPDGSCSPASPCSADDDGPGVNSSTPILLRVLLVSARADASPHARYERAHGGTGLLPVERMTRRSP